MKVLKFNLSGRTAFFKKPENNDIYFTYSVIPRVTLLGLIGSIMGLGGYIQQGSNVYPEFYEKLKDLSIGVEIKNLKASKKIHTFNNTTGFANLNESGKGATLNVRQQWLESPNWDIYIELVGDLGAELEHRFLNRQFMFKPYLGSNDHFADISNIEVFENVSEVDFTEAFKVDSLFLSKTLKICEISFDFDADIDLTSIYKFQENIPISLDSEFNLYEKEKVIQTNSYVECIDECNCVCKVGDKVIQFI